jgi:aldose 1-epimerase
MNDVITLRACGAGVRLAPAAGGAVVRYWDDREGRAVDWLRPTPDEALRDDDPYEVSAFPLVPYSNRIRDGRFEVGGRSVALPLNRAAEPHSIHGHGWQAEWRVVEATDAEARLEYRHAPDAWPWDYHCTQRFRLTPSNLTVELALANLSDSAMPAGLGWHPYFPRTPRARITAEVRAVWLTDAQMMPTALISSPVTADLARGVAADELALDNCFTGWSRRAAIEWPEIGTRLVMTAESPLDFLVLYTPRGRPFFCAEPVSHSTDAFNLAAAGRADVGARLLPPGESLYASITLAPER